jgi:hypothetical protein
VRTQPFSGPLSSEPMIGSVRLVVYAGFRSPISRVPVALDLLSRNGSLGCLLRCVHEASDFRRFPASSRGWEEAGYWSGPNDRRLEGEWGRQNRSKENEAK